MMNLREMNALVQKQVFLSKLARLERSERKRAALFSLTDFEIQPTIRFDQLTDSQSTKDPIRSVHTMVSTPYRVDALTLCPKTCHRFSYTLVCRADSFARFRAIRTISSSGCWYCIAVLTSLWPIVFITAARFPVLFSTRVP